MPGNLTAEDAALAAHPLFEEGMADAVDQRGAALGLHYVGDCAAGADVVQHRLAGMLAQQ